MHSEPPDFQDEDFPPEAVKSKPKSTKKKPNGEAPTGDIPVGESAFSLIERDLPEPIRLCDPWATEGVTILAGRPKLGKTTLMRQMLAAAAIGGSYLDSSFKRESLCTFLSLEEGELLTRMKFKQANFPEAALAGIQLFFAWPRGLEGIVQLERYLTANPDIELVVIDSLSRFRQVPDSRTPPFTCDYEAVNQLHECANRHPGVCIVVIHHTRKGKSDDPLDDISGTYGLSAAADTCMVLRNHADGATIYVAGRLWTRNDNSYVLRREDGRWEMLGVNLGIPDEQIETFNIIKSQPAGISGTELGDKLGITPQSAWQRIDILIEKGFVVKRHGKAYEKGKI